MNGGSAVGSGPCNRIEIAVAHGRCAAARGILPFGLSRQSTTSPFAESVRFVPDHCHDRISISFLPGRYCNPFRLGKPLKSSYGDLRLPNPKIIADLNGVRRPLVFVAFLVAVGA